MIGQTLAIFVDAYRDLNARKLFWVALVLSAVLVGAFAIFSWDATGLKIVTAHIQMRNPAIWYKYIFTFIIISLWLTWAATVLALISTAGIFPEFISGGSIDLYLAKPIARVRLFLTKYLAALLFVTLQVVVVAVGGFLVLGIRGREWDPHLFLAIPIVLCFFSYLFAICVLLGIMTRSTIAALLLTLLCWTLLAILDRAEPQLLVGQKMLESQASYYTRQADLDDSNIRRSQNDPKAASTLESLRGQAQTSRQQAHDNEHTAHILRTIHNVVYAVKTITPKTTDTIGLLDRYLFSNREAEVAAGLDRDRGDSGPTDDVQSASMAGVRETMQDVRARSPAWIIGTSLAFEVVLIAWAAWLFARRDY